MERTSDGRFAKGNSGKKKGTKNKATQYEKLIMKMIGGSLEHLVRDAIKEIDKQKRHNT